MDKQSALTLASIAMWVIYAALAGFFIHKIAGIRSSSGKKFGWFFVSAIAMLFLFGLPGGIAYLLIGPLALAFYPEPKSSNVVLEAVPAGATIPTEEHKPNPLVAWFGNLAGSAGGIFFIGLTLLLPIGELYWLWLAIKHGSFAMFASGLFFIVSAPLGAWSLIFGLPEWVAKLYGL